MSNVGIGKAIKMKGEKRIFIVKVFFILVWLWKLAKNVSEENKHTNVNVNWPFYPQTPHNFLNLFLPRSDRFFFDFSLLSIDQIEGNHEKKGKMFSNHISDFWEDETSSTLFLFQSPFFVISISKSRRRAFSSSSIFNDLKCWTNNSFKKLKSLFSASIFAMTAFDRRCQHRNQFNIYTKCSYPPSIILSLVLSSC